MSPFIGSPKEGKEETDGVRRGGRGGDQKKLPRSGFSLECEMMCNESLGTDQLLDQRMERKYDNHRMYRPEIPISGFMENPRNAITENERARSWAVTGLNEKQGEAECSRLSMFPFPLLPVVFLLEMPAALRYWLLIDYWEHRFCSHPMCIISPFITT